MINKSEADKQINDFKKNHVLEGENENIAVVLHLTNTHRLDPRAAMDQCSMTGNDSGIDGWYFDNSNGELIIYQGKLSEGKKLVLIGLKDLIRAKEWLEQVFICEEIKKFPQNPCLHNLYKELAKNKNSIKKISFVLISLFNQNELEDSEEYKETEDILIRSKLNKFLASMGGKLDLRSDEFNLDKSLPISIKKYTLSHIDIPYINLSKNSQLELAYIPLYELVELYNIRGDNLFHKNIRFSVTDNKEVKERLVTPMEDTLNEICSDKIPAEIFPFYHVGITIAADSKEIIGDKMLLERPSIINGCQTITIAKNYLNRLKKGDKEEEIKKFNEIKVVSKIVTGINDEELKQITNSNNRQIPIENWQLFSNDSIHFEIEYMLKDFGIFYERQKGKFESISKKPNIYKDYNNTNGTYIPLFELGQIICLSRRDLQKAAKPSLIFVNKKTHDSIFDDSITKYPKDMIFISNLFKAIKRALKNYLDSPEHMNDATQKIFSKPIVKTYMYYVALIDFYQDKNKENFRKAYSVNLAKNACPPLVKEIQPFYSRVITKTKRWYLEESRNFEIEVSNKAWEQWIDTLCNDIGVDLNGQIPFIESAIDWSKD